MAGRERLRPEPERACLSGDRQPEQLRELDHLLAGAAPGDLVADAQHRVLGFEQRARRLLDVILVGTDAHRHVELGVVPDRGARLRPQGVGGEREKHRAAGRRGRELQAAAHGVGDRRRGLRRPVPLGDRLRHGLDVVGFLEQLAAERALIDRSGGDQDRDLVLPAVHHLGHRVGQTDIGHDHDAGLARGARIAVRHRDHRAFVNALDELDAGLVHQRVEDRIVRGRRIEEDVLDARGLELLDEERAARSGHLPDRGGRSCRPLAEGLQRLRHRFGRDRAHAERAQARHQLPAGHSIIEILLDQLFHGVLPDFRPFGMSGTSADRRLEATLSPSRPPLKRAGARFSSAFPACGRPPQVVIPGRAVRREPGIHKPRLWLWIPGPALTRRPGMTMERAERLSGPPILRSAQPNVNGSLLALPLSHRGRDGGRRLRRIAWH